MKVFFALCLVVVICLQAMTVLLNISEVQHLRMIQSNQVLSH